MQDQDQNQTPPENEQDNQQPPEDQASQTGAAPTPPENTNPAPQPSEAPDPEPPEAEKPGLIRRAVNAVTGGGNKAATGNAPHNEPSPDQKPVAKKKPELIAEALSKVSVRGKRLTVNEAKLLLDECKPSDKDKRPYRHDTRFTVAQIWKQFYDKLKNTDSTMKKGNLLVDLMMSKTLVRFFNEYRVVKKSPEKK